jgi:hypothetical protein
VVFADLISLDYTFDKVRALVATEEATRSRPQVHNTSIIEFLKRAFQLEEAMYVYS